MLTPTTHLNVSHPNYNRTYFYNVQNKAEGKGILITDQAILRAPTNLLNHILHPQKWALQFNVIWWKELYTQSPEYNLILSAKPMLNRGICNMNVPYKIFHEDLSTVLGCKTCQLYWGVVRAPEPKEDHNFTQTVTTNQIFRMTGINFFSNL